MYGFRFLVFILAYLIFFKCIADNFNFKLQKIASGLWTYIAPNEEPNKTNQGQIANITLVEGEQDVLVYDAGSSKLFAQVLIKKIKSITNKPIKYLVLSHRQFDHAYGVEAFKEEGAVIFFDKREFFFLKKEGPRINSLLVKNLGFKKGNINFKNIVKEDFVFLEKEKIIDLGNRKILIKNLGNAHTHGDIIVYDYKTKTYIVGDFIFEGRAAAFSDANILLWKEKITKDLSYNWKMIIPGHGMIITNKNKLKETTQWLDFLDKAIKTGITRGDMIAEIFEYPVPDALRGLKMKEITLRQGLKRQIDWYSKKKY